jgi:hypothetical protein
MQKAVILMAIFLAVAVVSLMAIIWSSVNKREDAAVPGDIMATKTAELRSPSNFSQNLNSNSAGLERAPSVILTSTPEER